MKLSFCLVKEKKVNKIAYVKFVGCVWCVVNSETAVLKKVGPSLLSVPPSPRFGYFWSPDVSRDENATR